MDTAIWVAHLEALQRLLDVDPDVLLSQRAGAVGVVKVEQALVTLDSATQQPGNNNRMNRVMVFCRAC
jgi:hypothetical protein